VEFRVEIEREEDGGWLAEVPELPGVLAYGNTDAEAQAKMQALSRSESSPIALNTAKLVAKPVRISAAGPRRC